MLRATWSEIDSLDPALATTPAARQVLWNVYSSLLGYRRVSGKEGAELVPDLAESLPAITSNGTVYTLRLRRGLLYSDGTRVRASDFEYTIKRLFLLASPGARLFSAILGADGFASRRSGDIGGIVVNDSKRTIAIKLVSPDGGFVDALASTFAALVPAGTRAVDRSQAGIPATGAYRIESYVPGRRFVLVRNPRFDPGQVPDRPRGNPDVVRGTIRPPATALQSVLTGASDYAPLTLSRTRLNGLRRRYPGRVRLFSLPRTDYFVMNALAPPFDRVEVRQAVNYAIARSALARSFGSAARPTQNLLPPRYPQYDAVEHYVHDLAKARQLVAGSGTAGMRVTISRSGLPSSAIAAGSLAAILQKLGYRTAVEPARRANRPPQIGTAVWSEPYPNPSEAFGALRIGLPEVADRIAALRQNPATSDGAWASLDRDLVVKYALVAPYLNPAGADFFGKRVDLGCYLFHPVYGFDFTSICAK